MRSLEEQDHYEVLEVPHGARLEDIERAYPLVRAAYEPRSLATYSVFGSAEVEAIRERIDRAYHVLIDAEARRAYDAQIGIDPEALPFEDEGVTGAASAPPEAASAPPLDCIEDLDEIEELEDEESGDFDGARLRRARMRRGIEIEDIADTTRINPRYLRGLEADAFDELPAAVYTRGFVTAYARAVGLDAQRVARSYMALFEQARGAQPRGRLLLKRR